MDLFWDTSAVVPLVFDELHTASALQAYQKGAGFFAWDWLAVEAEAALSRRKARNSEWEKWSEISRLFQWVHLPSHEWPEIRKLNRHWMLRAADAAHLYAFRRVCSILPDLRLVTFDDEQLSLASKKGFRLF
ncbi:PIN domain-containing protein [bacterium]|nr:PIN domain-containing protein [bacterium]